MRHHDDGECEERLTSSGMCPFCGFNPDQQDTVIRFYCPSCNVKLDSELRCPTCHRQFIRPS